MTPHILWCVWLSLISLLKIQREFHYENLPCVCGAKGGWNQFMSTLLTSIWNIWKEGKYQPLIHTWIAPCIRILVSLWWLILGPMNGDFLWSLIKFIYLLWREALYTLWMGIYIEVISLQLLLRTQAWEPFDSNRYKTIIQIQTLLFQHSTVPHQWNPSYCQYATLSNVTTQNIIMHYF